MDPFLISGVLLIGWVSGYIQATIRVRERYERDFKELQRRVKDAEERVDEWEKQEQPEFEARILERMYRK